ncbi:MAG: hypothetical protein WCI73_02365 [Phycisphaerae bacterium]
MGKRRKDMKELFKIGDIVQDGDGAGIVVAGATSPTTGDTFYIFMESDGHLNGQYHNALVAGKHLDQPVTVYDLEGRKLLANLNLKRAADPATNLPTDAEMRNDALNHLDHLAGLVLTNGHKGSPVVKAFRVYHEQANTEKGPTFGAICAACHWWEKLESDERRRILNGWRPEKEILSARAVKAETIGETAHESANRVLSFYFGPTEMHAVAQKVLTHGFVNPVEIAIVEGTTQAEAIECLELALAAVRAQWGKMIDLEYQNYLKMPRLKAAPPRASKKATTGPRHSLKLGGTESSKAKAVAA